MWTHRRYGMKLAAFALIVVLLLGALNRLLMLEKYYNHNWPETSTYEKFYEVERDTIDVLFLGSSHCVSAFSPQELYNTYEITSYNLGSEQQSVLVSYYWLREALQYQTPKAVVLDTYIVFPYKTATALNSSEAAVRLAIDPMRWSSVKREAVHTICETDENQTELSYYLTNFRYHGRWSDLTENDFTYFSMSDHEALMGYSALSGCSGNQNYTPFEPGSAEEKAEPAELMLEYLDKIVDLCKAEGIELILVKTPSTAASVEKYNYLAQYADSRDIEYVDYNAQSVYEETGYEFASDNHDGGHLNVWGAKKVTDYIGNVLVEEYGFTAHQDSQWEKSDAYYETVMQDCELTKVTDIYQYLELLDNDRYTIFMAVKDDVSDALDAQLLELMCSLGLSASLENLYQGSYYAVIDGDQVWEEAGYETLTCKGSIRNGAELYEITSEGMIAGNSCSILIDETEYAKGKRGLNIVVYCNDSKKVIDSVCFDTSEGLAASR
ncbi:MAG: hypothetical protein LUC60_09175 [Lachnospiraceae bacterium]|nr:hypothetical protein [Lachnospiraceae bacterium]